MAGAPLDCLRHDGATLIQFTGPRADCALIVDEGGPVRFEA